MTKRIDIYVVRHSPEADHVVRAWRTEEEAEQDYRRESGRYMDKYTFIGPSWRGLSIACVQLGAQIGNGDWCGGDEGADWTIERIYENYHPRKERQP